MLRPGGKKLLWWLEYSFHCFLFDHCLDGLPSKKDNMGSSLHMFDMRLVDGTLEHDLCYPGKSACLHFACARCAPSFWHRRSCCKAKSSAPLIAMGWSVLLRLSCCNHHRFAEFFYTKGMGCLYLSVLSPRESCPRFTWHLVFGEDYETPLRQDWQGSIISW